MRAEVIRTYKEVHSWVGIISGMALFIAFFAGALTIFKAPLAAWAKPPIENAIPATQTDSAFLVESVVKKHPEAAKAFVMEYGEDDEPLILRWREGAKEGADDDKLSGQHFSAWVDGNGDVQISDGLGNGLGEVIDVLHRVVGLPMDTVENRWVMGFFAVLYGVALISGIILVIPRIAKEMFAFRLGSNLKRMWLDTHNIVGIVSLPFHLVIVISAATFAMHDPIYELQKETMHGGQGFQMGNPPAPRESYELKDILSPAELMQKARSLSESFHPTTLEYFRLNGPMPMVQVLGVDPARASITKQGSFVMLDPYSGNVVSQDYLPENITAGYAAVSSLFALHFGSYGGELVSWCYFFLGLSGAWLFYSGNLLWLESRRRKQKKFRDTVKQDWNVRILGSATIGVCLGCVAGIALTIASAKWLYIPLDQHVDAHQAIYYSVFFISIIWAFWRGAARGAIELLWSCALFLLLIPATSLIGAILPGDALWAHASIESLGVDLTALLVSGGFAVMAKATAKRVKTGPVDSLWSAAEFQKAIPAST